MTEEIIEPELPIIDPHHHLWDIRTLLAAFPEPLHPFIETAKEHPYYTFDEFHADLSRGHNVVGTVFMECSAFYRADGEERLKVVGEVEFANGVAAQGASGLYGDVRPCAAIIGHADLRLGDGVAPVLEALASAAPERMKGIRHQAAWDSDPQVLGLPFNAPEGLYRDKTFREGFAHIGKAGMTFDAWLLEPQLADLIDLARAFPDQPICLNHCGTPLGIASYSAKLGERFDIWRDNIHKLAESENVVIKLGGLAMPFCSLPDKGPAAGLSSTELAEMWRPYIETCIEAFGPNRAMFESNYPVDFWAADYPILWNTFKRLTSGASGNEKRALFAGSAAKFYGIEHILPG